MALAANREVSLGTEIQVNGEYNAASVVAANVVTSRRYDMQAIYDTIAKEGAGAADTDRSQMAAGHE